MSRPRDNLARAFTLIELILVLVIMATIATIAVPSIDNFERGQRVGDTADQLVTLARWARTESIARGITIRLNIDQAQSRYWLSAQDGPSYENVQQDSQGGTLGLSGSSTSQTQYAGLGEEMGREFILPGGLSISSSVLPQPDGLYITFRPTGRCDSGTIRVIDNSGKVIEVGCLTATESYHVLTDEEKQFEQQQQAQLPIGSAAR